MRNFKKVLALVLATMMVTAMAMSAIVYADPAATGSSGSGSDTVTITVNRDPSYEGDNGADSRVFTWYRIFRAFHKDPITSTGGGASGSGAPGDVKAEPSGTAISYYIKKDLASKLGTWGEESGSSVFTPADGNEWFEFIPTVVKIDGVEYYSVRWTNDSTDSATAQAAAQWLIKEEVYEAKGNLEFKDGKWSDEVIKGYYVLESVAGKNLIAATTDINVYEKNEYPPLDKTQKDQDENPSPSGTYGDANVKVAVGDVINYQVEVTVPMTAKTGEKILVWDKASTGLEYDADSVTVTPDDGNVTEIKSGNEFWDASAGWTWAELITVTDSNKGQKYTFTFSMTVTSDAIVDSDKKNESGLKYGPGSGTKPFPYESKPDQVEFENYFGGIKKIDGATSGTLAGVKFMLKEGDVEFPVTLHDDGYYYYDPSGSSEVVTDASGTIKIRGLDSNEKTYTLTETYALPGYNMLEEPVTLELVLDSVTSYTYTPADSYTSGTTYYTKSGTTYTEAKGLVEFASGTEYYTRSGSTISGTYFTYTNWQVVENNSGTILPSTGGIGTTIFYIVGGLLAVGAGVVLVAKKRMGKVED